eukprot:CAMPEP_0170100334 /NCGR_PEP_ID=MMETSP0020_2-20130122/1595_1 /TAXON_ID=98059 /ORGANISM="Dinobryon sp., Strain UTEXLB2267" /LENGTH=117 /DNA_ID=CAMNT_0010323207 /DNA_START=38 /DNA_END=388 /DNA_ORIENTATION=+
MDFFDKQMTDDQLREERQKYCNVKVVQSAAESTLSRKSNSFHESFHHNSPSLVEEFNFEMIEVGSEWFHDNSLHAHHNQTPKTSLFIIDPQVDFHPGGSLAVPGANEDSQRIADMIK